MREKALRRLLLPAALTFASLFGAMLLGVPGLRQLASAHMIPPCSNTTCSGYDRCVYGAGIGCSFSGPESCTSTRC